MKNEAEHGSGPAAGPHEGRVVIVTGASSGIGAAIAARLVADGAMVIGASRRPGSADGHDSVDRIEWVACDVSIGAEVDALVEEVVERHGRLDAVVNNAGVQIEHTIADTTDDEFDRLMAVNVRGVFNGCRAAVRAMAGRGGGVIVNIGSTSADHADAGMAVYNATKGAVHALTRSVAIDHGRDGVRCVAVAPGWIATALAEAAFDATDDPSGARRKAEARHPVGRMGRPEEIAGLVSWLIGDDATFASGSIFTLDGGATAQNPVGA